MEHLHRIKMDSLVTTPSEPPSPSPTPSPPGSPSFALVPVNSYPQTAGTIGRASAAILAGKRFSPFWTVRDNGRSGGPSKFDNKDEGKDGKEAAKAEAKEEEKEDEKGEKEEVPMEIARKAADFEEISEIHRLMRVHSLPDLTDIGKVKTKSGKSFLKNSKIGLT